MTIKRYNSKLTFVVFSVIILILTVYWAIESEAGLRSEPASERLAYVTQKGIYLINPDGSNRVNLGRSLGGFSSARVKWSPTGTQIAYNAGDLMWHNADLYVVNVDGTDLRFLTNVWGWSSWGWSPDGQYIVLDRSSHMGGASYALIKVVNGEIACQGLYDHQSGRDLDCFPINLSDGRLWSGHLDSGYSVVVTDRAHEWALTLTLDSSNVFRRFLSPDEEWMAFTAYNYASSQYSWNIARANDEVRTFSKTAVSDSFCYAAAWSIDSQNLVFGTYEDHQASLWITNPKDNSISLLIHLDEEGCPDQLKWASDGQHISFSIYPHPSHRYRVSVPGGELESMPPGEIFEVCEWSLDGAWLGCLDEHSAVVFNAVDGERFDVAAIDPPGLARLRDRLAWSSSGRWFAVNTNTGIYSFDTTTHETRRVTSQEVRGFGWSPSASLEP